MRSSIFNKNVMLGILSAYIFCTCAILANEYSKNNISLVAFVVLLLLCFIFLLASVLLCYGLDNKPVDDNERAIDFLHYKSGSFVPCKLKPGFHDVSSISLHVYNDLCHISQDLKLLVSHPSAMTSDVFSYDTNFDRCCFLFLNFRQCFDSMLNKLERNNVFIKEDHINIVDVERLLTKEESTFLILAAQLIVRNSVLYSTYPEVVYKKIVKLAGLSVEEVPFQERLNAANRIIKLLGDKVYSFGNMNSFHKFLESVFRKYMSFVNTHAINSPRGFYKMRDHSIKLRLLKDVFCASYFKYYSVYQDRRHGMVRIGVDFTSDIIKHYDEYATKYDSDIVQYLNEMRESGFAIDVGISNASVVLNAKEIMSKVFEQTAVLDDGCVSCFSRYSFKELSTIQNAAMKMIQRLAHSEFDDVLEGLDACALVNHVTLGTSPYNRMFISQKLTTSVDKEGLIFNIYYSLYRYANIVKKVSNSIDDFKAYEMLSTSVQNQEYYILYPLLKSVLDTGLSILHTRIKPGSPISQDDVSKIFSSYDISKRILSPNRRRNIFEEIVCCARITCCLPHLLETYPDDVVNHIKALANVDIGENKYRCVEYLVYRCYDICVFSDRAEFQQMMNSFLTSYSSYYQSLDERLRRRHPNFLSGSSFDIVLMHLMYTSLYNSEMVEQRLIDDACDRMKSLDFDSLRNFYMSFMQVIANTMNFGYDQIYFPLYEINTLQNDIENDVVSDEDDVCESTLCLPSTPVENTCNVVGSSSAIAH